MKLADKNVLYIALCVVLFPVVQIYNLSKYAAVHQGWVARISTAFAFLPVFIFTTVCWAAGWLVIFLLAKRVVGNLS
jgi:hypothetical protein